MKSKTIILSSQANQGGHGILTLTDEDGLLSCRIRLYNLSNLDRFSKLGIYHQKQVYSANLLEKNGAYLSSLVGDFDLDQDFYAAIVDTKNDNNVIISGGTYSGYFFNNDDVFSSINETETAHVFDKIETANPNTNIYCYSDKEEKENLNSQCDFHEACKTCKYKEFFYSQQNTVQNKEPTEKNIEKHIEKADSTTSLIESIAPQFQYVFENFPLDKTLNSLIPNGKFVKIDENSNNFLENNEQYSIGAIYENDEIKYICYAVMRSTNCQPPKELGEHYQWLPLDKDDPLSDGYFIVFQDATDLKIVEL